MDSQGNSLEDKDSDIIFVDQEQERERAKSRPDIPNNLEIL